MTRKTTKTIGREGTYIGTAHTWAKGLRIQVRAIHRGPSPDDCKILTDDTAIGAIRPGDLIEFAPEITEKDGTRRWSWVTSDANLADVEF